MAISLEMDVALALEGANAVDAGGVGMAFVGGPTALINV